MKHRCRIHGRVRGRRRSWPAAGVSAFLVDPDADAAEAPAHWNANLCPYVVILDAVVASLSPVSGPDLAHLDIVADLSGPDGRHLVVRAAGALHRLWLRASPGGRAFASIALDAWLDIRLRAVSDLHRSLLRHDAGDFAAPRPTRYQAHRLALLLAILG